VTVGEGIDKIVTGAETDILFFFVSLFSYIISLLSRFPVLTISPIKDERWLCQMYK